MTNSITLTFESLTSAVAIQAFQCLILLNFTFRSVAVDVDHVGSTVQVRSVMNLVALFFG